MKRTSLFVLMALLLAFAGKASGQESVRSALQRDLRTLESFGFSGAVLVEEQGHTIVSQGYGSAGDDLSGAVAYGFSLRVAD